MEPSFVLIRRTNPRTLFEEFVREKVGCELFDLDKWLVSQETLKKLVSLTISQDIFGMLAEMKLSDEKKQRLFQLFPFFQPVDFETVQKVAELILQVLQTIKCDLEKRNFMLLDILTLAPTCEFLNYLKRKN